MKKTDEYLVYKALGLYLPYSLEMKCSTEKVLLVGLKDDWSKGGIMLHILTHYKRSDDGRSRSGSSDTKHLCYSGVQMVTPILRPLSDLTKEIEINGERFVPINALGGGFCCEARRDKAFLALKRDILRQTLQIHHFEKLLEWHFDVFGLIEKGLAIDINTINK